MKTITHEDLTTNKIEVISSGSVPVLSFHSLPTPLPPRGRWSGSHETRLLWGDGVLGRGSPSSHPFSPSLAHIPGRRL